MKKKTIKICVVTVLIVLFIGIIPFPKDISYRNTEIEYSRTDESVAIEHEVIIEGIYYTRLLAKDRFKGKLYISDVGGLEEDMTADFWFHPRYRYHPLFSNWADETCTTAVGLLFFSRNFETLAIQLAYKYEERGSGRSVAHGDKQSNFIVLGASTRDGALEAYDAQLVKKMR